MLQRRKFFLGRAIRGSEIKDISFFNPSGQEMSDEDWNAGFVKCLGVRLAGDLINDENERGEPIVGETLLILLNGHWEPIPFTLPSTSEEHIWDRILDTADLTRSRRLRGGQRVSAPGPLVRGPGRPHRPSEMRAAGRLRPRAGPSRRRLSLRWPGPVVEQRAEALTSPGPSPT